MSAFALGATPGTYAMPVKNYEEPRKKPMFQPGTVWYATEMADVKELDRLCLAGKENGYHESVTLQEREDLLGMMPIHIAAEKGHVEIVKHLIKKRVDLDAGDKYSVTALHLAAIENHADVVQLLVNAHVDVKAVDTEGDSALHWAATRGHVEVAQMLIKAGATVDVINKQCWTPLHRAAYNGRKEMCVVLTNAGASLAARNRDGNTPLHLAAFMNQLSIMESLLGLSARCDQLNVAGKLPLDLCITDAARELIQVHGGTKTAHGVAAKDAKPKTPSREPVTITPYDGDRGSARMDTSKLTEALKAKQKAAEDFPDFDDHRTASAPAEEREEGTLYMRASGPAQGVGAGSEFLSEVSMGFDSRANPYSMGYQNMGENDRSSSGSIRSSANRISGLPGRMSVTGDRPSAGARAPAAIRAGNDSSIAKRLSTASGSGNLAAEGRRPSLVVGGQGGAGALRARASVPASQSAGPAGWEGASRLTAADYQQKIRDENRRTQGAGAGAAGSLLAPPGGQLGVPAAAATGPVRPASGNKKFLAQYNLERMNLFAP